MSLPTRLSVSRPSGAATSTILTRPNSRGARLVGRTSTSLTLTLALASCAPEAGTQASMPIEGSEHLFVWTTDADSVDLNFLAVLDANPRSPDYGSVLTTLAIPTTGATRGHHTEHRMPSDGRLFANDFGTGMTYVLDLSDPLAPQLSASFTAAGPLTSPHSFERLPNGNVVATFQTEGPGNHGPGGIAELGPTGEAVRWGTASGGGDSVRPYSLAVVPALDRVVTGSADMRGVVDSHVIQIWRLSDLTLLETLSFPEEWGPAAEPRLLSDGETVLVSTFGCKLIRVEALGSDDPVLSLAYDFEGSGCALPVVAGDLWIQAVPGIHGLVAIDASDAGSLREVSRLTLGEDDWPHWISLEPSHRRIVVTGYAGTRYRVLIVDLDESTGEMHVDTSFASPGAERPGISFDRTEWPHGATGPADPHGAVFSLPGGAAPDDVF